MHLPCRLQFTMPGGKNSADIKVFGKTTKMLCTMQEVDILARVAW